ncbi:HPr kinase/phosphorylase [Roseinatronobacter sp. NSM]|uniref:HPr kinase/phosphorylase n=1 Tax=Roseinatronobacter sp. NSM TaxID=3457785 RepID=UPI0040360E94
MSGGAETLLHASAVALETPGGWHAIVAKGRSGSGKSELALELMALGARLVADDQTRILRAGENLFAQCPAPIRGLVEMRGIGLIAATPLHCVRVSVLVDMDVTEETRMPPRRVTTMLGVDVPTLHKVESKAFAAALRQYVLSQSWLDEGARP